MAGKTYVTKGYSTHTNIPTPRGGYDHGRKNPINEYVVETKKTFGGSPSKIELLKEYVHLPGMSTSPTYRSTGQYNSYEPDHGLNYENSSPRSYYGQDAVKKVNNDASWPVKTKSFSGPILGLNYDNSSLRNYYGQDAVKKVNTNGSWPMKTGNFSSPVHGYPSEEARMNHTGPGLERARDVWTENYSGPNKSWQTVGPPATHHPITTPTNDVNEALGFLEESVHYSPRSDPRRRGVLDELSTRAQPLEPHRRYARPTFVTKPNDVYRKRY